jgi:hypothetical protein
LSPFGNRWEQIEKARTRWRAWDLRFYRRLEKRNPSGRPRYRLAATGILGWPLLFILAFVIVEWRAVLLVIALVVIFVTIAAVISLKLETRPLRK